MMKQLTLFACLITGMLFLTVNAQAQVAEKEHQTTGKNFKVVTERNAEYPGGNEAMYMFFYKNMEFPKAARENNITGKVNVSFQVEPDSSTSNVSAMNDLGHGTAEEAVRLVKLLKFAPAIQNGKAIRQNMMVTVIF
ncbi:MAG: energy transducer TonB [Bacteroidia bacterium]|nr:energy transducer TonB [Bacteroidia bacterium]